jgi:hypothetical protein
MDHLHRASPGRQVGLEDVAAIQFGCFRQRLFLHTHGDVSFNFFDAYPGIYPQPLRLDFHIPLRYGGYRTLVLGQILIPPFCFHA